MDNVQYKTYPQTYSTREEAEDELSVLVIKKLGWFYHPFTYVPISNYFVFCVGVTHQNVGPALRVTKDLFIFTQRVIQLLGN